MYQCGIQLPDRINSRRGRVSRPALSLRISPQAGVVIRFPMPSPLGRWFTKAEPGEIFL